MDSPIIRWGIIGPGKIARKFADDLRLLPQARLHAVASTSLERAQRFAADYQAPFAYGHYEDLMHCPDLDVVYVATPHAFHFDHTLLCLENGLAVLCEKPFALSSGQARQMVALARQKKIFLMEGLWTCFIPAVRQVLAWVREGAIGRVHTVKADFGFVTPFDPASRLFDPDLGGGALLDIGIYPALLAQLVLGKPTVVQSAANFAPNGVDESCAFTFHYPDNRLALGHATFAANTPVEADLYGESGAIHLHPRWHHTQRLTLSNYAGREETKQEFHFPYEGWGYSFEAAHVMECLAAGKLESDVAPLEFTLELMETLDAVRGQWLTQNDSR